MRKAEKVLWILVALAIVLVIIGQIYLYFQVKATSKDIATEEKVIKTLTDKINMLNGKKEAIPKLEAFFENINKNLLFQSEAKQYIGYITDTLDAHGISYNIKVSSVESVSDKYEIVTISISFSTKSYSDILDVIKTIENEKKWTEISAPPSIKSNQNGYGVSLSITIPYVTDIADNFWDIK